MSFLLSTPYKNKISYFVSFHFKAFRTMASSVQALASGSIAAVSLASLAPASQKLVSGVAGLCVCVCVFFLLFFSSSETYSLSLSLSLSLSPLDYVVFLLGFGTLVKKL
jgi:hypothetical protein